MKKCSNQYTKVLNVLELSWYLRPELMKMVILEIQGTIGS